MFQAKEGVLDRIEQSFTLFFKRPVQILLPLLIFNIIMLIIIPEIGKFAFGGMLTEQKSVSSSITILIYIAVTYALFYLICIIPITYATIKTICETIKGENTNTETNIREGFSYIGKIFKVYWFVFSYAYLMPALCFITGGFILLGGMFLDIEIVRNIGMIFMGLSALYALIQGIYRGLKTSFALQSAIYNQDYEKNNFETAIRITDGKWWRILGNYLLVGIIGGLMVGLLSGLINSFGLLGADYGDIISSLSQEKDSLDLDNIQDMFKNMTGFNIFSFIASILNKMLDSLLSVFVLVFSVVFYLRLRDEYQGDSNENDTYSKETLPVLEEL